MPEQLCWTCQRACGRCPWSEYDPEKEAVRFAPVPGWIAIPTVHGSPDGHTGNYFESFDIRWCPLYTQVPGRKRERAGSGERTRVDLTLLRIMTDAGYTIREIGARLRVSEGTVKYWRKKFRENK